MSFTKSEKIAYIGLLTAMQIILARFLSINTPITRIGFSFLPLVLTALIFGTFPAVISAVIADIIGSLLFPTGSYFPGFTLSAALFGLSYGMILYNKPYKHWRVLLAVFINTICISLILNTYWIYLIGGRAFMAILPGRILQNAVLIPVKIIVIRLVAYRILDYIKLTHAQNA